MARSGPRLYIHLMALIRRQPKLVGEKVELRRHRRENYRLYGEWYADPEVWRLTSWAAAPPTPASVEQLYRDREASKTEVSFAIHPRGERTPVGVISLMNISEANGSAELSVIIGPPAERHRGYGSDAISTLVRYGFEELGLNRVGLSVFEFNETAISAYKRLGFREEGRLRGALKRDGAFHDAILMATLKEDRASRPR